MTHFSAPPYPLIYSFLLRREEFHGVERLIVETREQGEKLLQTLEKLGEIDKSTKHYRLITTQTDLLEVTYSDDLVGIFPIDTLDWRIEDEKNLTLMLTKGMKYPEELLVTWLTDNGFRAVKSDEENTFFRQGDTVSIETRKGTLLVNFFGTTLETLYLGSDEVQDFRLFSAI